jgi:regulator of sigma E protease
VNGFDFMMPFGQAVFWGVITLSVLVVLHEGGHFLAARLFGVNVAEFMIGLPGPALRWRGKRTTFGVTAVPLGGYVRIAGMEPGEEDPLLADALWAAVQAGRIAAPALADALAVDRDRAFSLLVTLTDWTAVETERGHSHDYVVRATPEPGETAEQMLARIREHTFRGQAKWKRVLILAAGVTVNIVAAIVVFTVVLAAYGFFVPTLTLDAVVAKSAAGTAGIKAGDTITTLNGRKLTEWTRLTDGLKKHKPGETVAIGYTHGGKTYVADVALGKGDKGQAFLGVQAHQVHQPEPIGKAFVDSLKLTGAVFVAIAGFFASIIHPTQFVQNLGQVRSVIGISAEVAQAARNGPLDYAWLLALLSLSLGAINILPLPPLDGGKVALELIERAVGRPISREWAYGVSIVGAVLLFSLIGYLMYADIVRLAAG